MRMVCSSTMTVRALAGLVVGLVAWVGGCCFESTSHAAPFRLAAVRCPRCFPCPGLPLLTCSAVLPQAPEPSSRQQPTLAPPLGLILPGRLLNPRVIEVQVEAEQVISAEPSPAR